MGMLEVTCVPAIMEETLIREYTVNLPTSHSFSLPFKGEEKRREALSIECAIDGETLP